jgi:hypothetical protein
MPYVPGHEEDGFLKKLDITAADIEAKADQCSKVSLYLSIIGCRVHVSIQ